MSESFVTCPHKMLVSHSGISMPISAATALGQLHKLGSSLYAPRPIMLIIRASSGSTAMARCTAA